jgi:hypothetical protein
LHVNRQTCCLDRIEQRCKCYSTQLIHPAVAHFRPCLHILGNLLQRLRNSRQLALNWLPLFIRRSLSTRHLPPPPWTKRQHPSCVRPPLSWELDPIRRHKSQRRHLWRRDGRPDPNWTGTAICTGSADEVQ